MGRLITGSFVVALVLFSLGSLFAIFEGIEKIQSTAAQNVGVVFVEVATGYDVRNVMDDVKTRVDAIQNLAEEAERPVVERDGALVVVDDPSPDTALVGYLRELAAGPEPLITMLGEFPSEQLALTERGQAVLAGSDRWLRASPPKFGPSRWRGGVEILGRPTWVGAT